MSHNANMQLEMRSTGVEIARKKTPTLRFRLFFSFDERAGQAPSWNWRELELEYMEDIQQVEQSNPLLVAHHQDSVKSPVSAAEYERGCSAVAQGITAIVEASTALAIVGDPRSIPRIPEVPTSREATRRAKREPHSETLSCFSGPSSSGSDDSNGIARLLNNSVTVPVGVIEDFCETLRELQWRNQCAGVLVDQKSRSHRVWEPSCPSVGSQPTGSVSLHSLISGTVASPTKKDRLLLGVKLASSSLELHNTEWLNERWGADDVIFPLKPSNTKEPIFGRPLVRRNFASSPPAPSVQELERSRIVWYGRNKTLFSLGVVLLELWFWKNLDELDDDTRGADAADVNDLRECVPEGLIEKLYNDAPQGYCDVVRRCTIGFDHWYTDLEMDDFKKKVYEQVVYPLEENLKMW